MLSLDFPVCGLLFLGFLQSAHLILGKDQPILRNASRKCLQALRERLQVMTQPNRACTGRGDKCAPFAQLVRHTGLPKSRLFEGESHYCSFNGRINAIAQVWLLARKLLQRRFPARIVQLFEPIEAIPAEPHHLACVGHIA